MCLTLVKLPSPKRPASSAKTCFSLLSPPLPAKRFRRTLWTAAHDSPPNDVEKLADDVVSVAETSLLATVPAAQEYPPLQWPKRRCSVQYSRSRSICWKGSKRIRTSKAHALPAAVAATATAVYFASAAVVIARTRCGNMVLTRKGNPKQSDTWAIYIERKLSYCTPPAPETLLPSESVHYLERRIRRTQYHNSAK